MAMGNSSVRTVRRTFGRIERGRDSGPKILILSNMGNDKMGYVRGVGFGRVVPMSGRLTSQYLTRLRTIGGDLWKK